jgi:hypothetical protein
VGDILLQLQRAYGNRYVQGLMNQASAAGSPNRQGLPDGMKGAFERLSGLDLSGVRVHYNSPKPLQFDAHAYTQGREIHVAPGQEPHLSHEIWHVVQQLQGRVQATSNKRGVLLNDDAELEREADLAGRASRAAPQAPAPAAGAPARPQDHQPSPAPIQLDLIDVHNRLTAYRKSYQAGTGMIEASDWEILKKVFSEWEACQRTADKLRGNFPAGWHRNTEAPTKLTKQVIESLNDTEGISTGIRRQLIDRWNKRLSPDHEDFVEFKEPEPLGEQIYGSGIKRPWGSLSPQAESFDPEVLFNPEEEEPERKKLRTATGEEEHVAIVQSAQDVALVIRSFIKRGVEIPQGFKFLWGKGLLERRSFSDIVYTKTSEIKTGVLTRVGSVDNWTEILENLPSDYRKDPRRLLRDLQAVFRGQMTNNQALELMAGAMLCDVKYGIGTWIQVLSELYPMLTRPPSEYERDPSVFRNVFKNWYVYIEARDLRGREPRTSYRKEPGRVETGEWSMPTLIPRRGGFKLRESAPIYDNNVAALGIVLTEMLSAMAPLKPKDIETVWTFALMRREWYNRLADLLRKAYDESGW